MAKSTEAMQKARREKAEETERHVLEAIRQMKRGGEKITFYSVAKRTGSSRSYLHNNEKICSVIKNINEGAAPRSEESTAVLLKAARMKIRALEAENEALKRELEGDGMYKKKYEAVLEENRQLRKQLQTAYEY